MPAGRFRVKQPGTPPTRYIGELKRMTPIKVESMHHLENPGGKKLGRIKKPKTGFGSGNYKP